MQAVGYFREDSRDRTVGRTLAEHNRAFLEYCERAGFDVAATFLDASVGDDPNPPGLKQLMEFLGRPERGFTTVVVPGLRHLGLDLTSAATTLFRLDAIGVQVVALDADDVLASLLEAWQARGPKERLGERVRAAMRRKAVKGEVFGRPPYGYKVGQRRKLELVPDESVVVRYIFRLYLQEGMGIRLIAGRLNEEGFKTRRGGNWSMVTIRDILRNRVYLGTYSRFGVRVPGSHPALISAEDFRRIQDRLSSRRTIGTPRNVLPFLLSGMVFCGYCGNKMIGVSRRQRWQRRSDGVRNEAEYRYYQCETRTNQSLCDYHTRRAAELEEEVRALVVNGGAIVPTLPRAGDNIPLIAGLADEGGRLRTHLKMLARRMESHLDAASRGAMTRDQLRTLMGEVARDHTETLDEMDELARRARKSSTQAETRRRRERVVSQIHGAWEGTTASDRQALLREVIDRIVVHDESIKVYLRP